MIVKATKKSRLIFLFLIVSLFLLAIGAWLAKPESQRAKILKDELYTIVTEQAGAKTNGNRVSDIRVFKDSNGWDVELSLRADKEFSMISTRQTMWQDAIEILAVVSEIKQLDDISLSWIYPVPNTQKEREDKSVMSFTIDKATRDQLIWKNIEPAVLPDLVYGYEEHPVLSE